MTSGTAPRYRALVTAAGGGSRMRADRPKQYLTVAGRTLLEHSIDALRGAPWIGGIVVTLAEADTGFARLGLETGSGALQTVRGGATRAESVYAGLRHLAASEDPGTVYVLVHDAARPCVTRPDLERLRDEASDENGGLLAVPVSDTLKRAEGAQAAATVDRRNLWRAQTPQMFRLDLLLQAMASCLEKGVELTDEASAMEMAGYRPRLVMGRESNVKVTYPEDLAVAEFWLTRPDGRS